MLAMTLLGIVMAGASDLRDQAMPSYKEISAKEVQEKAANGPIIYDHVAIIGDLDLNQDGYQSINITNSIIGGNISLSGTTIYDKAIFMNSKFQKNAEFNKTRFNGDAVFNSSYFSKSAFFRDAAFSEDATFDYATFGGDADFTTAKFDGSGSFYSASFAGDAIFFLSQFNGIYANFESTIFQKYVDFTASQFNAFLSFTDSMMGNNADFHSSRFSCGTNFHNSTFPGKAGFSKCHFSEDSFFTNANFSDKAEFKSAKFDGPSYFKNTTFHQNAIFDNVQFLGPSDFSDVQFAGDLGMNNTKISTMILDGSTFNDKSRLFLAKADINRLMVRWSQIKDILCYDTSAYLSLVKNYRDLGTSDADDCYYQFRKETQNLRNWGWAKVLDILADIACGYGVRADRPVMCSLFLILTCASFLYVKNGLISQSHKNKRTSLHDALYYCLAIFFTIPLPDLKPAGNHRYVPVVLRALGWVLFALLVATLGKMMIR
jgi:hypothetical protein